MDPVQGPGETKFTDIPFFVRGFIFKHLSYKNQRNVKLTCKTLQWNVDFSVEVRAILDFDKLNKFKGPSTMRPCMEELLTWLETARVQTLRVGNLKCLVFDPQRLFRNQLITQLFMTLDSIQKNPKSLNKFRDILCCFKRMKVLEIRFNNPTVPYHGSAYYKAHQNAYQFVANLLTDLQDKLNLEELSIFIFSCDNRLRMRPLPPAPFTPQEPRPATVIFPFKLKVLNLCLRDLSNNAALAWNVMLDQQDSLQALTVDFGDRLGPIIYQNALIKSSASLVHAGLKLYNKTFEAVPRNRTAALWSSLQHHSLKSLKIWFNEKPMADSATLLPNWSFLSSINLERLDLKNVRLTNEDLTAIFYRPSTLKVLNIRNWTELTSSEAQAARSRADASEITRLIIECIEHGQFYNIQLVDQCLKYCIGDTRNQLHDVVFSSPYIFVRGETNWAFKRVNINTK